MSLHMAERTAFDVNPIQTWNRLVVGTLAGYRSESHRQMGHGWVME